MSAIAVDGIGVHSGARVRATLFPRAAAGIVFRRTDLAGSPEIPAHATYLAESTRQTVLCREGASIGTVEHLLAACRALGVESLDVAVDGPELPIGDGSAAIWSDALRAMGVGAALRGRPASSFHVREAIEVHDGERRIALAPAERWSVHFDGKFPDGTCRFASWTPETDFATELAPARTFVRLSEVVALRRAGHIRGGSPKNALVWIDIPIDGSLAREIGTWWPDVALAPGKDGLLAPQAFRLPDEPARHKLVDLLGDLSLAWPAGPCRVEAEQAGHDLAHRLLRELLRHIPNAGAPHGST